MMDIEFSAIQIEYVFNEENAIHSISKPSIIL